MHLCHHCHQSLGSEHKPMKMPIPTRNHLSKVTSMLESCFELMSISESEFESMQRDSKCCSYIFNETTRSGTKKHADHGLNRWPCRDELYLYSFSFSDKRNGPFYRTVRSVSTKRCHSFEQRSLFRLFSQKQFDVNS